MVEDVPPNSPLLTLDPEPMVTLGCRCIWAKNQET